MAPFNVLDLEDGLIRMGRVGHDALARTIHKPIHFFEQGHAESHLIPHDQGVIAGLPTENFGKEGFCQISLDIAAVCHPGFRATNDDQAESFGHKSGQH